EREGRPRPWLALAAGPTEDAKHAAPARAGSLSGGDARPPGRGGPHRHRDAAPVSVPASAPYPHGALLLSRAEWSVRRTRRCHALRGAPRRPPVPSAGRNPHGRDPGGGNVGVQHRARRILGWTARATRALEAADARPPERLRGPCRGQDSARVSCPRFDLRLRNPGPRAHSSRRGGPLARLFARWPTALAPRSAGVHPRALHACVPP